MIFHQPSAIFAGMVLFMLIAPLAGQDLEPRAYSASPTNLNFLVVGFGRSNGGVVLDPAIPIANAHADIYSPVFGLGRTFGLFGRQALITAALPYAFGHASGEVGPQLEQASITRSGLADFRAKFSLNLRGSPALSPQEFAKTSHHSLLIGASLTLQAPTGQYGSTKLVNLGTNRWALRPELGMSYPWKHFYFDLYAGAWFFTPNNNFFPGNIVREQEPLSSVQAHVSYTLRQRFWLALDGTWYTGGDTILNGGAPQGRQNNSRLGVTLSLPLGKMQSLKVAYSDGVTARFGAKFSTITVAWQIRWFDPGSQR